MRQKIISFALFIIFHLFAFQPWNLANNSNPASEEINKDVCNLAPPAFLMVTQVGTTWLSYTWPSVPGAFAYRIVTTDVVTGLPVSDITVPASTNIATATNLIPGRQYFGKIWSICYGGEQGQQSTISLIVETIIIELVGTGYNGNTHGWSAVCQLSEDKKGSCSYSKSGSNTYFNIKHPTLQNVQLNFMLNVVGTVTYLYPNENDADCCNDQNKFYFEPVGGQSIKIAYNCSNCYFAEVSVYFPTAQGDGEFYRMANNNNNSSYIIEKIAPVQGLSGDIIGSDRIEIPESEESFSLSASPNPFTKLLDLKIPFATEENDVRISLYDLQGRLAMSVTTPGGAQTQSISTQDLQPGLYLLRVETGDRAETIKVLKTQ